MKKGTFMAKLLGPDFMSLQVRNLTVSRAFYCAETIHIRAHAPSDSFLMNAADQVRQRLTDEMDPSALKSALVRGQAMSALEAFASPMS